MVASRNQVAARGRDSELYRYLARVDSGVEASVGVRLWVVLSVLVVSLVAHGEPIDDTGPIYERLEGTGLRAESNERYGHIALPVRERALVWAYSRLRLGMTRYQVSEILGPPDVTRTRIDNEPSGTRYGWAYKYFIRLREGGPIIYDQSIQLYFGVDGRLDWAVPGNLENLVDIGRPTF